MMPPINNPMLPILIHHASKPQPPRRCPNVKCGKVEHIIEVCAHCGYKYAPPWKLPDWVIGIMVVLGMILVPLLLILGMSFFGPGFLKLMNKVECASPWRDKDSYAWRCQ